MTDAVPRALLFCAALATASEASAAETTAEGPGRKVRFDADRLELDSKHDRLELDGHVVVTVDRYRLTSDRLSLERGPRGVVARGGGRVAFCPCPDPPVTLGFRSATVAPPTDLLLEQPTLRAFGVPVFWLPYLWLRSPRRFGLLPLDVAYRGRDGVYLGSGLHAPLGETSSLDVGAGAYFEGGVQVDARLVTPRTASAVRWDHLRESAVAADLRGVADAAHGATVAWSVDALRGPRALRGPALLEEVALRHDRARLALGSSDGKLTAGVEAAVAAARGGPLDAGYAWAPGTVAAIGGALGTSAAFDVATSLSTWRTPTDGTLTLVTERAELRGDLRAGPLRLGGELRSRGSAALAEYDRGHAVVSGVGVEASLPLVREFGPSDGPVQHFVAPFIDGAMAMADSSGQGPVRVVRDGAFYMVSGGIRTVLGEVFGNRAAASLSLRLAELGDGANAPRRYAGWLATAAAPLVGLRSEGVVSLDRERSGASTASLRVGPEDALRLVGRAANRSGPLPVAARLVNGGWDAPFSPWFDVPGWSVGGGAVVPWTRFLASAADVDYDVASRTLLGWRTSLGYRHPCRCLAMAAWVGHRLGRPGVDTWLTVDLMP